VVTTSSSSKYNDFNNAASINESGKDYTEINKKQTKIVDGKKVTNIKPISEWAVGKYQHYYRYQKTRIKTALEAQGIKTDGLSNLDIINTYAKTPKAQEAVQEELNGINFEAAKKQIKKYALKASVEEIAYLNHFLGNVGAETYLNLLKKHNYNVEKVDKIMAYGDGADIKGIGGPDSEKANPYVSVSMLKFRKNLSKIKNPTAIPKTNPKTTPKTNTKTNTKTPTVKTKLPPITNFPVGGGKYNIGYDKNWDDWENPTHNSDFSIKATNAGAGGHKKGHIGVDIFGPKGAPILSPVNGIVKYNNGNGLTIIIVDPVTGYSHWLGHLDKRTVPEGTVVVAGTQVGELGNTGNAKTTAPHLHYNIYSTKGDYYTGEDPLQILVNSIPKK